MDRHGIERRTEPGTLKLQNPQLTAPDEECSQYTGDAYLDCLDSVILNRMD
jgi:hypothetical protein